MKRYFISINNEQQGPYSLEELKQLEISLNTLIWFEGLEEWKEAKEIEELQDIIISLPPPLPHKQKEKELEVQTAGVKKKVVKVPVNKNAVAVAKEVKVYPKLLFYSLLMGLIAFPILYFFVLDVPKYDDFNYYTLKVSGGENYTPITLHGVPEGLNIGHITKDNPRRCVEDAINRRKEDLTGKSITYSVITFIIGFIFLLLFRYGKKGVEWVDNTSKLKE